MKQFLDSSGALACADILLTLGRRDFQTLLGQNDYGLPIETPGEFLRTEREAGLINPPS